MSYRNNRTGKYSANKPTKGRGGSSLWKTIIVDILMVGVILVIYAMFHHVIPAYMSEYQRQQEQEQVQLPVETEAFTEEVTEATVEVTEEPTEEIPTETEIPATEPPDLRTEWQKKFEEHFSDEIIWTENSYKSPNVSITIETKTVGEGGNKTVYHVADIYVGSMNNFVTHTANGEMRYWGTQDVVKMSKASDALIAISGDFLTYQNQGFLMRNGEIYQETSNLDSICVLFADGTMETYDEKTYDIQELKDRGAVQVWSFGPVLLDENGQVRKSYKMPKAVSYANPRSAIGYYEPGHYCFVVVDGRQDGYSKGLNMPDLARIFEELGCKCAYNLDGGGSAVMVFNHQRFSRQSNGGDRGLGDILVIREYVPEETVPETEEVTEEVTELVTETGEGVNG